MYSSKKKKRFDVLSIFPKNSVNSNLSVLVITSIQQPSKETRRPQKIRHVPYGLKRDLQSSLSLSTVLLREKKKEKKKLQSSIYPHVHHMDELMHVLEYLSRHESIRVPILFDLKLNILVHLCSTIFWEFE